MPAKSAAQEKLMRAVAHNPEFAKKTGIPQNVGKEFTDAAGKQPTMKEVGYGCFRVYDQNGRLALETFDERQAKEHLDLLKKVMSRNHNVSMSSPARAKKADAIGHENADRLYKQYALLAKEVSEARKKDSDNKDYREALMALKTCEKQFASNKPNLALIKEELRWAHDNLKSGNKMSKKADELPKMPIATMGHDNRHKDLNKKKPFFKDQKANLQRYRERINSTKPLEESKADAQEYTKAQVLKKLQEGEWDTSYDVVPGKHLEVSKKTANSKSWKSFTIFVRPDSIVSFADVCAARGITYDKHAYIKHVMAKNDNSSTLNAFRALNKKIASALTSLDANWDGKLAADTADLFYDAENLHAQLLEKIQEAKRMQSSVDEVYKEISRKKDIFRRQKAKQT